MKGRAILSQILIGVATAAASRCSSRRCENDASALRRISPIRSPRGTIPRSLCLMRYMGDLAAEVASLGTQNFTAAINTLPDDKADQFLDAVDASNPGHSRMLMRYGIGGAVGLVVGFVAAKLLR